MEQIPH